MAEVVAFHLIADIKIAWRAIELYLEDKGIEAPTADAPWVLKRLIATHGMWEDLAFRGLMENWAA